LAGNRGDLLSVHTLQIHYSPFTIRYMAPDLHFRLATRDDLATIVEMLLDDPLGATREKAGAVYPLAV
jgi:hypothetical protein